jgi:lipopolysaccharide transport system permease protein
MSTSLIPGEVKVDTGRSPGVIDEVERPHIHIKPWEGAWSLDLGQLWRYRNVVYLLVWRDFKVKYKQSAFGVMWLLLHPFCNVLLYSFFFGVLAHLKTDGQSYALFNYVGMLPWMLFATSMASVSQSLLGNAQLVQKIYFPRMLLPIHGFMTCLPDFIVSFSVQMILLAIMGVAPTWNMVWLPLMLLWVMLTAVGVGLFLAGLIVRYRDVASGLGLLVQLWFYATPVAYATDNLPDILKPLAAYNPMTWVVNSFRWAILGTDTGPKPFMIVPIVGTLLMLLLGTWVFKKSEKSLADVF